MQFCARLREERERRGLNQDAFAALGGVKKNSQTLYETGKTPPSIDYLYSLADHGVDIGYILTGQRRTSSETAEIRRFVGQFTQLSRRERRAIEAMVAVLAGSPGDQLRRIIAGGSDSDILGAIDRAAITAAVHDDAQEYRHED